MWWYEPRASSETQAVFQGSTLAVQPKRFQIYLPNPLEGRAPKQRDANCSYRNQLTENVGR